MFIFYQNFLSTAIPAGWSNSIGANGIVTNGLNIKDLVFVSNTEKIPTGNIIEANFKINALGSGGLFYGGDFRGNIIANTYPLNALSTANNIYNAIAFDINAIGTSSFTANFGILSNDTTLLSLAASSNTVIGIAVNSPSAGASLLQNGLTVATLTTNVPSAGSYHIEFVSNSIGRTAATFFVNWTRVRTFPPNDVMVSATFPSAPVANGLLLTGNPNPPEISNTIIDVGQYSTINTIVSNGFAPYIGAWFYIAPNTLIKGLSLNNNTITANILSGTLINDLLTIHPTASQNTILTFNGASYSVNMLGTNDIYGIWSFNTIVEDAAANYLRTAANTLTINPAFTTTPTLALSNTLIDQGQSILFTASGISGGTSTYTYNYQITNSINNVLIANQLFTGCTLTTNTFFWTPPANLYTANTFRANVFVTDSATTPINVNSILHAIGYNSVPLVTITPSNVLLDAGQTEVYTFTESGGTGTFNSELVNFTAGGSGVAISNVLLTLAGTNTIHFVTGATGTFEYNTLTTDKGTTTHLVFNGITNTIIVYAALATPTIAASNASLDPGQNTTISSYESGGSGSFTYNFIVFNSVTHAIIANQLGTSNTFIVQSNSLWLSNSPVKANVIVKDIGITTPVTANSVNTANIPISILKITPNAAKLTNTIIDVGQISVVNTIGSGGSMPYSGEWTWLATNQTNNNVTNTIPLGTAIPAVAFNSNSTLAYATGFNNGTVSVINTSTNTVINTIVVDGTPYDVAFNPNGTLAYVTNIAGSVNVISVATNTVINTITVPAQPLGVAFNPAGTLAYVTQDGATSVSVINVTENAIVNTIGVGAAPAGIAINQLGTIAYVTNDGGNTVSVINLATNTVTNAITVGNSPLSVAINPSGAIAYVTNEGDGTISVINIATNTVINTITDGGTGGGVAFNPSGTLAYVTNERNLSIINVATNTIVYTDNTSPAPYGVAIAPSGTVAYVTDVSNGNLSVINPSETALQSLPTVQTSNGLLQLTINAISSNTVSFTFNGVTYTAIPVNKNAIFGSYNLYGFVNDSYVNSITVANTLVINAAPTLALVPSNLILDSGQYVTWTFFENGGSGPFPTELYNATGSAQQGSNRIITSAGGSNTISFQVSSPTSSNTFTFAGNSYDEGTTTPLAFKSTNGTLGNVVNSIAIGASPQSIDVNTNGTLAYAADFGGTVSVINTATNTVIKTISTGGDPYGVSFNPNGTLAYVVDFQSSQIFVIDVATNSVISTIGVGLHPEEVTFNPSGTLAYVTNFVAGTIGIINVSTNTVVNTINVGGDPFQVAITPSGNLAYVTNEAGGVNVINTATNTVIHTIPIAAPFGLSINPSGTLAYVTDLYNSTVSVINIATNTIIKNITVAQNPSSIALSPDGTLAYVPTQSGKMSVINTATNTVIDNLTIAAGDDLVDVAINPSDKFAYVIDANGDTDTVLGTTFAITVNPTMTTPSISTPTPSTQSPGNTLTWTTSFSGGSAPYTYNWTVYNTVTGAVIINQTWTANSYTGNAFSWTIPANMAGNTINANVFVTDSATTSVTLNSVNSGTITIVPPYTAPSTPTLTLSNTSIDQGQSITFNASVSGGAEPYTYNYIVVAYNTLTASNQIIANMLFTSNYNTTSNWTWTPLNLYIGNTTFKANVTVTDADSSSVNSVYNSFGYKSPTVIASASNALLDSGQYVTYTLSDSGGFGPINAYLSNLTGIGLFTAYGPQQGSAVTLQPGTSNTVSFQVNSPTSSNVFLFHVISTDNGATTPYQFFSSPVAYNITDPYGYNYGSLAFSPGGTFAFAPAPEGVRVIGTASNSFSEVSVGQGFPTSIVASTVGNLVYTAGDGTANVYVINWTTNTVVNTISTIMSVSQVAINPSGTLLFAANSYAVSVINTATNSVVNTIPVFSNGFISSIAVNPQGTQVYVLNGIAVKVINITSNSVVNTISTTHSGAASATEVAFNPSGTEAYVSEGLYLAVINTATNTVNTIVVLAGSQYINFNPSGSIAYATKSSSSTISLVNVATNTVIYTFHIENQNLETYPIGFYFIPSTNLAYLPSGANFDQITVVDSTFAVTVNPALTTPSITTPTPSTQATGNVLTFTTSFTGGTAPYTYNWIVYNTVTKAIIANQLWTGNYYTGNSFSWNIPANMAGNTIDANVFVTDSASTPVTVNSVLSGTITIASSYTPFTTPTLMLSNTLIDQGQYILFSANIVSTQGTAPFSYAYNVYAFNAQTSTTALIANQLYTGNSYTSNAWLWNTGTSNLYVGNSLFFANVVVTDAHPTTVNSVQNAFGYNSAPVLTAYPSNGVLDTGQWVTWTLAETGGTGAKFNTELYNVTGSSQQGSNRLITSVGGSNTISFQVSSPTVSNVFLFGANSYDEGTTFPFTFGASHGVLGNTVNTITTGGTPKQIALSPDGSLAYVTDYSDTLEVINVATNTVINSINVGTNPEFVAFSPSGSIAYATNGGFPAVTSVINVATNTVINTIDVGGQPFSITFSPSGSLAYVTNIDGFISVVNVASNTVVNTITVDTQPQQLTLSPSGAIAYVTNIGNGTVSVINISSNTVINNITVGSSPVGVAFNPSGTFAYVANECGNDPTCSTLSGTVSVIDVATNTVINTIAVGADPAYVP